MNILKEIEIFWAIKDSIQKITEAIPMDSHNYFSTEFISKVVVQLLTIIGMLKGFIPANYALIAVTSLTALYMVLRTIYKIKNPGQDLPDLPASDITTSTTVTTSASTTPAPATK